MIRVVKTTRRVQNTCMDQYIRIWMIRYNSEINFIIIFIDIWNDNSRDIIVFIIQMMCYSTRVVFVTRINTRLWCWIYELCIRVDYSSHESIHVHKKKNVYTCILNVRKKIFNSIIYVLLLRNTEKDMMIRNGRE